MQDQEKISKATPDDVDELNALINAAYRGDTARQGCTHEADLLGGIRIDHHIFKYCKKIKLAHVFCWNTSNNFFIPECLLFRLAAAKGFRKTALARSRKESGIALL